MTLCAQVDHVDFHVDKTVTAQPATVAGVGVDVSFDVVYDPSSVGDCRSHVTLTSSVGGDYVFPLRATCTLPKPQACRAQCLYVVIGLLNMIWYDTGMKITRVNQHHHHHHHDHLL